MRHFSFFLLFLLFAGFFPGMATAGQPLTAPLAQPQPGAPAGTVPDTAPPEELFDIKGPVEIPDQNLNLLLIIAALLTVLLIIILI